MWTTHVKRRYDEIPGGQVIRLDARWLNLSEGLDNLQKAVRLGRQVDDPEAGLGARFWLVQARLGTGQRQEAGLQASVMLTTAEGLCHRFWLANGCFCSQLVAQVQGKHGSCAVNVRQSAIFTMESNSFCPCRGSPNTPWSR